MRDDYSDIIELPHPEPARHPRMPAENRAAQFAPFAALTGYEDAIEETARLTDDMAELNEDSVSLLDEKLAILRAHLAERPVVTAVYFQPDEKKEGGVYTAKTGIVKKIDDYRRVIVMEDGTNIPVSRIAELDGELLSSAGAK